VVTYFSHSSSSGPCGFALLAFPLERKWERFPNFNIKFAMKRPKGSLHAVEPGCMVKPE
jgi:hypothetical protein